MADRYAQQFRPPEAQQITDVAINRHDKVFGIGSGLTVRHADQQTLPDGEKIRIAHSEHDHLQRMHDYWTARVVSGEGILRSIDEEKGR